MGNLMLVILMLLGVSVYALAQNAVVAKPASVSAVASSVSPVQVAQPAQAAPAVSAPAPAPVSVGFVGILLAVVAGFNVLLSGAQKIFSTLSKSEPGWLQSLGSIMLEISKLLGSNPNV